MDIEKLRFPIGEFKKPDAISKVDLEEWKLVILSFPDKLEAEIDELKDSELAWIYRPNGWSIKQVVHHCADSHMNAFIRFKLAITEDSPQIKPYMESLWAEMEDVIAQPVKDSLMILSGVHSRWNSVMKAMTVEQLKREFIHPEHGRRFSLEECIGLYAWHCNHHFAHVRQAIEFKGKFN